MKSVIQGPSEKQFKKYKEIAIALHIPVFESFLELEVRDSSGKVVQTYKDRAHSWNRNFYNLIYSSAACEEIDDPTTFGDGLLNYKSTNATVSSTNQVGYISTAQPDIQAGGYRGPSGDSTYGILVGSNTQAFAFNDFALVTQIVNGTGSGQLSHVLGEIPVRTWTLATRVMKNEWTRYFNNNSGAAINVNEVGLVSSGLSGTSNLGLVARDVLGTTVSVPNNGQLKTVYTIQVTYPS